MEIRPCVPHMSIYGCINHIYVYTVSPIYPPVMSIYTGIVHLHRPIFDVYIFPLAVRDYK